LAELYAEDARWEGPNSTELPGGGTHEGRQAILQMLGRIPETWENVSVVPDEFHEDGDDVLVLGHITARAKPTGRDIQVPFVQVFRMQGGTVKRQQVLTDTLVMADALGLRG